MNSVAARIRRVTLLGGVVSLAVIPVLAHDGNGTPRGQYGPPRAGQAQFAPPPGMGGLAIERLARELGLTDAEKAQVGALLTQQRTALKATLAGLRQAQQQLDAAVTQIPPDNGLVQAQVSAVSLIQAQLLLAHSENESKIYQLLTPDQQQKVQEWIARMQQRGQQSAH